MPKVETASYAVERQKWQTKPQAILRFHHVPSVEILIPTETERFLLGGEEGVSLAEFRKLRGGTIAGEYDHAQGFFMNNALRTNATLELDLLLRREGDPSGNIVVEFRADAGGQPAATPLDGNSTKTLDATSVTTSADGAWVTFVWAPNARPGLVPNTPYWFVVRGEWAPGTSDYIEIARNPTGSFPNGDSAVNTQGAPNSWSVEGGSDLLFRGAESVTSVAGVLPTQHPFSRDFASGPITAAQRPILECIEDISGNTATVDPPNAKSSVGNLTVVLTDRDGEIFRQAASLPMRVAAMTATSPGPGQFLNINESNGAVASLPARGTFAVRTAGVIERIRYDLVDSAMSRIRVVARGVDGTTAAVHAENDLGANGEEIRQGQRVSLFLGYEGLAQSEFMVYQNWDIVGRKWAGNALVLTLSDMQRHLRKTVFTEATPDLPYKARGHPVRLALAFLMSTGTGINGGYDLLRADAGLGLPSYYVDVPSFENLEAEYPGVVWDFSITGPTDGKAFLEEQFFRTLGCYPVVTQFGQYALRKFRTAPAPETVTVTLTEDDSIDFEGPYDGPVLNEAVVEYDFDLESRPHEFGKRTIYTLTDSIAVFGRKPPWTLRHYGLKTADGAEDLINRTLIDIAKRYGTTLAPPMIKLRVPYRRHTVDIGDLVKVTHSKIPHPVGGGRGVTNVVCEVQDITPTFLARGGGLTLTLIYVGGIPTLTGGWKGIPFDLGPVPPPPPSGIELVINGQGQGNSPVFWGRDVTVRWNAVGPIDGQEPLGGDPMATGPRIEGYSIEVYSPGQGGELVLRRGVLVKDTQTTYPYEANAADHGGVPARTVTGRWRTQLPGGVRSARYSEFTATNPAPSMAGFTPITRPSPQTIVLFWIEWARHQGDLDIERYEILYATSADEDWDPGMTPNKTWGFVAHPTAHVSQDGLTVGLIVRVMIRPWDVFGPGTPSEILTILVGGQPDTVPPAPPTGLALTTGTTFVDGHFEGWAEAEWNRNTEPDMARYVIRYRELGTTPWHPLYVPHPTAGPTVTFRTPGPMTITFEVQIAAEDLWGNLSAFAPVTPAQITIGLDPNPATPTGLSLSTGVETTPAQDGSYLAWVQGTWNRNTEQDVLQYVARAKRTGTVTWEWHGVFPQTAVGNPVARVPNVLAGVGIDVEVQAVDRQGHASAFCTAVSITTASFNTDPAQVAGLSATPVALGIFLDWDPVQIPDLDHYEIHESASNGFTPSGTTPGSGTCFAWVNVTQYTRRFDFNGVGLTEYYKIIAVRVSGNRGAASAQASATVPAVDTPDIADGAIHQKAFSAGLAATGFTTSFTTIQSSSFTPTGSGNVQVLIWAFINFRHIDTGNARTIELLIDTAGGSQGTTFQFGPFIDGIWVMQSWFDTLLLTAGVAHTIRLRARLTASSAGTLGDSRGSGLGVLQIKR